MRQLAQAAVRTPVGELTVTCSPDGVARVIIGGRARRPAPPSAGPPAAGHAGAGHVVPGGDVSGPGGDVSGPGGAQAVLARVLTELTEYFAGERRVFSVPLDWPAVPGAGRHVLSVLHSSVAYGETITYGQLARRAGVAADGRTPPARAVGRIMSSNPLPVIVPCHRVVAGTGLGGYSGGTGPEIKRWLLAFEGAIPATLDWDPAGPLLAWTGPA